jgi:DNA repair protein RadC
MASRIPAYRLQLVRTGTVLAEQRECSCARDAADLVREFLGDPDREHVVAVYLDVQNKFVGVHLVAVGAIDFVVFNPAEVYKAALLCNASTVVLAHNHPSGEPAPSQPDRWITERVARAGSLLGIPLVDHIVIGQPGYVSLRELGWIDSDGTTHWPRPRKRSKAKDKPGSKGG